ncbi:nucleotidyltransferase domain-containing protein, partial [candidate division KSB1 bacterium]|nr:nucleotidyltransferase domain-containing protein [candidate division KSB1 bacterium]
FMKFKITQKQQDELAQLFRKFSILTVYLFGSQVEGEVYPESDIDIGIYFYPDTSKTIRIDSKLLLINEIGAILKSYAIDLVVLNDVPIFLQYEIIQANSYLYIADDSKRVDYEIMVMSIFLDQKYYFDRFDSSLLEQIKEEGLK